MFSLKFRGTSFLCFALCVLSFSTTSIFGASASVSVGKTVSLLVAANGKAPFSYQWYKDNVAIKGATASGYVIGNIQLLSAGVYHAVVSNSAGSTASDQMTLVVASLVVFTTQPVSKTVTAGGSVTFAAAAIGLPSPTYQWRKNGTNIAGATGTSYTISSATTGSAGTYSVVATNLLGSATSNGAVLTVSTVPTTVPVFTTQPISQMTTAGIPVTFTAMASGSPAPSYQWKKNGVNISGATGASYTIASAVAATTGSYSVTASNSVGSATSNAAELTIKSPPSFTSQPSDATVKAGSSVTFTASATGLPAPAYQWMKNGVAIGGATGASYTVASVSSTSAGTYSVTASNSKGSVSSNGAVLVVKAAAVSLASPVDLNGDGQNDLVWQNISTGECVVWLMSGTKNTAKVTIGTFATSWRLSGVGDFNADGKADLVWQSEGKCFISLMSGATIATQVSVGAVSSDWEVKGTGDYDGSGQSDLLFQNNVTGERSIWLMSGTTVKSKVSLGTVDIAWEICGSGDFNSDGKPDVIWQNILTGQRSIWLMAGTKMTGKVSLGTLYPDWEMGCAGDFNGDGQTDILWQNLATGECFIWLMSGTQFTDIVSLGTQSPAWVVGN